MRHDSASSRSFARVHARRALTPQAFGLASLIGWLCSQSAYAQTDPPPPPPIPEETEAAAPAAEVGVTANANANASQDGFIPAEPQPTSAEAMPVAPAPPEESPSAKDAETKAWFRRQSLRVSSTLSGSAGLMRVREAGSGDAGTFRVNLAGSFFSQGGFLCNEFTVCLDPVTGAALPDDSSTRAQTIVSLSVTPFPFLEAFFNLKNAATSNSSGRPSSLQTVGEPSLGIKGFMPKVADRIYSFGAEAELMLLTGSGGVGLSGGSTSFALRGLGTLDLNNRTREEDRIPLRAHVNFGYYFDNSGQSVASIETTPPPNGRGEPIQRPERFGLGISRVDALEIGLGAEVVHDYVRPFLEWTLEAPINRQGYVCNIEGAASRGDLCLGVASAFNTTPQRLTLGARVFPWQASGLSITGALDIGTGATTIFVEEIRPEMPYNLWLAVGYAVDTRPPEPVVIEAPVIAPPSAREPERRIAGVVVDETSGVPLGGAVVMYDDPGATGMVANSEGAFRSGDLAPGEYKLLVRAPLHRDGECTVVVPEFAEPTAPAESEGIEAALQGAPAGSAPADSAPQAPTDLVAEVTCSLKELPRVGNVVLVLVDAETGATVPTASVTITDPLSRSLELQADNQGSLQFNNVPFGTAYLVAQADNYLKTVMPVVVDSREDLRVHVVINRTPKKPAVRLAPTQITLLSPIQFVEDTDQVAPQSMLVVEQLAALLRDDAKAGPVEIGVHSAAGGAGTELALTQARADSLRQILVRLGVDGTAVEAKGYGSEKPIATGTDEASVEKNNRVEITRKK